MHKIYQFSSHLLFILTYTKLPTIRISLLLTAGHYSECEGGNNELKDRRKLHKF